MGKNYKIITGLPALFRYSDWRLYQYNENDFSILVLTSFFKLQVNKGKLLIDSFSLFPCLCVYNPIHAVLNLGKI